MTSPGVLNTTRLPAGEVSAARTRLNRVLIAAVMIRERQIDMIRKGQDPRTAAALLGDGPDHPRAPILNLEAARSSRAHLNKVRSEAKTLPSNHPLLVALARAPESETTFGLEMHGRYAITHALEQGPIDIALLKLAEAIETDIAHHEATLTSPVPDDAYLDSMKQMAQRLQGMAPSPTGDAR